MSQPHKPSYAQPLHHSFSLVELLDELFVKFEFTPVIRHGVIFTLWLDICVQVGVA
jgi:hypothetical protein